MTKRNRVADIFNHQSSHRPGSWDARADVIRWTAEAKADWARFQAEQTEREEKERDQGDDMPDDPELYRNRRAEDMP